ncbi:hypothetical protein Tco_0997146 [Tanacetum coccineum]
MASLNTRFIHHKLDGNIIQKHGGSKQVGFKQLGPDVETGVHGVHDEKRVWFEVELQGAQRDREAEVFQTKEISVEDQDGLPSSSVWKTPIDMLGFFGWLASIKQGMLEPVKVKCIFLGYHKRCCKELSLRWNCRTFTFEVEPHRNVDHVVGSQEVQTRIDLYYHPESCLRAIGSMGTIQYREDSNDSDGYYWESTPRFVVKAKGIYLGTPLLSLEGNSLSGDCEWKKNGKLVMIYMRCGSHGVVGWSARDLTCICKFELSWNKFDRGLLVRSFTRAWKKEIWLKGLLAESGYELSLVAGIATGALVKGGSRSEVPAQVEGAAYRLLAALMVVKLSVKNLLPHVQVGIVVWIRQCQAAMASLPHFTSDTLNSQYVDRVKSLPRPLLPGAIVEPSKDDDTEIEQVHVWSLQAEHLQSRARRDERRLARDYVGSDYIKFAPWCLCYDDIESVLNEFSIYDDIGSWANVDDFQWSEAVENGVYWHGAVFSFKESRFRSRMAKTWARTNPAYC